MNLKSLAIKNHSSDNEPKTAYIECEGKGVVTAADIQADQDIEIMNPDQVIATLNGGKRLQTGHGTYHYQGTWLYQRRQRQNR